ncbi:hypothetical protein [Mucilaginibacter sp. CSA2-8R]|uniref:hypothetical protein n=1 Tax=Mucilaginibacter sp. CSA2-8R TaxID=3141542 RepID=UPI00315D87C0
MNAYRLVTFLLGFIYYGLLINLTTPAFAQTANDSVDIKMRQYQQAHPASLLFAHFDKTVYTNNDNVWLTAYLLNCAKPELHNTLTVALVNDLDKVVVLQKKFVMESGIAFGNMLLPDTIAPGNYSLLVYTNRLVNNKPEAVFQQPVTIKTTAVPDFKAVLYLPDTNVLKSGSKSVNVTLSVTGNDYMPVPSATVKYKFAGNDTSIITGLTKTDKAGQLTIAVPRGKNVISAQIKKEKNTQFLYLALPRVNQTARVKFYPEGGSLVANLPTRVGWEVTTPDNEPLKVIGFLYENNKVIDTLQTSFYGMGSFSIIPKPNQTYTVKLKNITQKDTVYQLPRVESSGVNVVLYKALANDTLNFQIRATVATPVYLHIHNYRQEFVNMAVDVEAYMPRRIKVALDSLPKGVTCITLTDAAGHPMAERLFFAHFESKEKLILQTDKSAYNTREKVQLSLKLATPNPNGMVGLVSIACVQANRIEAKKVNDITSYTYLKRNLQTLPVKENYMGVAAEDKSFLEQVLLVKGWRDYKWTDIVGSKQKQDVTDEKSVICSGTITASNKPVKKPVNFILKRDSSMMLITTDAGGNFILTPEQLITEQDAKIRLILATNNDYTARFVDPYKALSDQLAKSYLPIIYEKGISTLNTSSFTLSGFQKAIQLKEVKVTAGRGAVYAKFNLGGTNRCGDYVCQFNILNCPNHVTGYHSLPIVGRQYMFNGHLTIYQGCVEESQSSMKLIDGIFIAKQFSGSDYAISNPTEPEYVSTIFWKHLAQVNAEKPTQLSFYTSDITGRYKIVVQGITDSGVIYSQSYITVNKK